MKVNDLWETAQVPVWAPNEGLIYLEIKELNPVIGAEIVWEGPINDPKNIKLSFTNGDNVVPVKIPGKKKANYYKYKTIQEAKDAGQEALGALLMLHMYETIHKIETVAIKYLPAEFKLFFRYNKR